MYNVVSNANSQKELAVHNKLPITLGLLCHQQGLFILYINCSCYDVMYAFSPGETVRMFFSDIKAKPCWLMKYNFLPRYKEVCAVPLH